MGMCKYTEFLWARVRTEFCQGGRKPRAVRLRECPLRELRLYSICAVIFAGHAGTGRYLSDSNIHFYECVLTQYGVFLTVMLLPLFYTTRLYIFIRVKLLQIQNCTRFYQVMKCEDIYKRIFKIQVWELRQKCNLPCIIIVICESRGCTIN